MFRRLPALPALLGRKTGNPAGSSRSITLIRGIGSTESHNGLWKNSRVLGFSCTPTGDDKLDVTQR
jgi:hypothetical protein